MPIKPILLCLLPVCAAYADIITDRPLSGPDYHISAELGRQAGANLFHSFQTFSLSRGESATFSGPDSVRHVISRVTGGAPSEIHGTLRCTIPGADLFLLNPAGLVFGAEARLDVSGGFHATTAEGLQFSDGSEFSVHDHPGSTLSVAEPAAFGFGAQPAEVTVIHSQLAAAGDLTLAGGDVEVRGSKILAPGGRLGLFSSAGGERVSLTEPTVAEGGRIAVSGGSRLDVSASQAGTVSIRGGEFVLDSAQIEAETLGDRGGGVDMRLSRAVDIRADAAVISSTRGAGRAGDIRVRAPRLRMQQSRLDAGTVASGGAGAIRLEAETVSLEDGALVASTTLGEGAGGNIHLQATQSLHMSGRYPGKYRLGPYEAENMSSFISTAGTGVGDAGHIDIRAGVIEMDGGLISADSYGSGRAGDVAVNADALTMRGGAVIASNTHATGSGGSVEVKVRDSMHMSGHRQGEITLLSGLVLNNNPTLIGSGALGDADAGNVSIEADEVVLEDGATLTTTTVAKGRAGNVVLNVRDLVLRRGGTIAGSSGGQLGETFFAGGEGAGGDIRINADGVQLDAGFMDAGSLGDSDAGNIVIEARQVSLDNGSLLVSSGAGAGAGGEINIKATESLLLRGRTPGVIAFGPFQLENLPSSILSGALGSGSGGNIHIETAHLEAEGGFITGDSYGEGAAGDVTVRADKVRLHGGAIIASNSIGSGAGGHIRLEIDDSLEISGYYAGDFSSSAGYTLHNPPSGLSSSTLGPGRAGRIEVEASHLRMTEGGKIGAFTGGQGDGGDVLIKAQEVELQGGSQISSGSGALFAGNVFLGTGDGGSVTLHAEKIRIYGSDGEDLPSAISSATLTSGRGGDIHIEATELEIRAGGAVNVGGTGSGDGGRIAIQLRAGLHLSDESSISSVASQGRSGDIHIAADTLRVMRSDVNSGSLGTEDAGNITIEARRLALEDGGMIVSSVLGGGEGGKITVNATESLSFSGAYQGTLSFGPIVMENIPSSILSGTAHHGNGGDIHVTTGHLELINGYISGDTYADGNAGHIRIDAATVLLKDGGTIGSNSIGSGRGGEIQLHIDGRLEIGGVYQGRFTGPTGLVLSVSPAGISTSTLGDGQAGRIEIHAPRIDVSAGGMITAFTGGAGDGGGIDITTARLALSEDAQITTSSGGSLGGNAFAGTGDAGDMDIRAAVIHLDNGAAITASTQRADGGNLRILVPAYLYLRDSEINTEVRAATGNGGNISVTPGFIVLDNGRINANAFEGNGGNIAIGTHGIYQFDAAPLDSVITASSQKGISGEIAISTPETDISDQMALPAVDFIRSSELQQIPCTQRQAGGKSRFTVMPPRRCGAMPDTWQ